MDMKSRRDMTGEKKDRELVLFDLFFEKLLENSDEIAVVTDAAGKIEFANMRYMEYFSSSEKEVAGEDWIDRMVPREKRPAVRKIFATIKEKAKVAQFYTPVMGVGNLEKKMCWTFVPLEYGTESLYLFIVNECKSIFAPTVRLHSCDPNRRRKAREEVINLLFKASTRCDPETAEHALRVMHFAEFLARKIKLSDQKIKNLKTASLLHDMGKLVVDPKILFKKGKLDKNELDHIKKHIDWGAALLRLIYFLKDIVVIMCSHHEDFDGGGYPEGLRGDRIPIEARILSIADIYEALTADRPYRKAFSREEAIAIMEYEKGHKLDPRLTDIFIEMVLNGEAEE